MNLCLYVQCTVCIGFFGTTIKTLTSVVIKITGIFHVQRIWFCLCCLLFMFRPAKKNNGNRLHKLVQSNHRNSYTTYMQVRQWNGVRILYEEKGKKMKMENSNEQRWQLEERFNRMEWERKWNFIYMRRQSFWLCADVWLYILYDGESDPTYRIILFGAGFCSCCCRQCCFLYSWKVTYYNGAFRMRNVSS